MPNIIQKRKIWLAFSGAAMLVSVFALIVWGLDFGIDFTGGSLFEARFSEKTPAVSEVKDALSELNLNSLSVQPTDDNSVIIRFQDVSEDLRSEITSKLEAMGDGAAEELRFESVGPSIGNELKEKSFFAIILVLVVIILYIAWAFRKVSKPVSSWKYGLIAVVALFHDVLITIGAFAFFGKFFGFEVNAPFIAAILTVLGYSVNDTIVVFDRLRENLPKSVLDFEHTVNLSVNQTLTRSLYTSATTILVLVAIIFFGGTSIRDFALALAIGIFVGTYSSIFVASPLLVIWEKMKKV